MKNKKKLVVGTISAALVASSLTPVITADAASKSKAIKEVQAAHVDLMLYGSNNPTKASFDLRKDKHVNKDINKKWKASKDYKSFMNKWSKLSDSEKKTAEMKKVKAEYQAAKAHLETVEAVFAYYNQAIKLSDKIVKDSKVINELGKSQAKATKLIKSLTKTLGKDSKRVSYLNGKANSVTVFTTGVKELHGAKTVEEANKALKVATKGTSKYSATFTKLLTTLHKEVVSGIENYVFDLSIMHTNDTHARVPNAPKMVTAVKEQRAKNPNSLLVNAGDVFSGTLYFNEFKGQADLRFMNLMQYDMMTFGNHEFDLGASPEGHKALSEFVKGAEFPFVSANVNFSADQYMKDLQKKEITTKPKDGQIYNGLVKEVNGEKVGFFGLTTEETADIASPGKVTFSNYIKSAQASVDQFEKMGINKIVAVTHIGYDDNIAYDNDLELAKYVDGIDVIVGGHSHTKLEKEIVVNKDENNKEKNPTVIVQAYQYADYLGTLDVQFDKSGKIVGHAEKLVEIKDLKEDTEAATILKEYSSVIDKVSNEKIGATTLKELLNPRVDSNKEQLSVRKNETELGNLITDGMLDKAKEYNKDVVMAFQNGGGIRAGLPKGEITTGDVITVLPFGNTLATMKLKGSEIKEALELSVSVYPTELGGFLHVSGVKVTFDSSKAANNRIVSIKLTGDNTELDMNKEYVIATNAFTAKGGDGYDVFKKAYEEGRVTDLGLSDWENLRDYAIKLKTIDPKIEGRIVDVKAK